MSSNSHELQSLRSVSPAPDKDKVHPRFLGGSTSSKPEEIGPQRPRSRSFQQTWTRELLAWCFAAVTLAILIAVLVSFNNKPQNHWHSGVSINTLVNALTTTASTALIFPVASSIAQLRWLWLRKERSVADFESFGTGPVDIFVMISKHPKMLLAHLGAINVILILLFGPITQETVALPVRQHNLTAADGDGSIAGSTFYQVSSPPFRSQVAHVGEQTRLQDESSMGYASVHPQMSSAIQLAITGTKADPSSVQASCITGNCTFEIYSTLGVCSRVDLVSHDEIVRSCEHTNYDGRFVGCNYTVKELRDHPPWYLGHLAIHGSAVTGRPGYVSSTLWIGSSDIVSEGNDPYRYEFSKPETLTEFYLVYLADTTGFEKGRAAHDLFKQIAAYKVGLDLCTYRYNTTVLNGNTKTVQIDRTTDLKWEMNEKPIGGKELDFVSSTTGGKEYRMEQGTKLQFNHYLGLEVFLGSSVRGLRLPSGSDAVRVTGTVAPASDAPNTFADLLVGKPQPEGQDKLVEKMENLAIGMTTALRISSDETPIIPGTASKSVVYISINFRWLILPILSVVLSLLFLLAVMFETARSKTPAWKGSSIAALLALDHDTGSAIAAAAQDPTISAEERAKELKLRLRPEGNKEWVLASGI